MAIRKMSVLVVSSSPSFMRGPVRPHQYFRVRVRIPPVRCPAMTSHRSLLRHMSNASRCLPFMAREIHVIHHKVALAAA